VEAGCTVKLHAFLFAFGASVVLAAVLTIGLALASLVRAGDETCHSIPIGPNTPSGVAGCVIYGEGIASEWGGPGVARNDCLWPWRDCQTIAIQSLTTGLTIIVTPRLFGDLYTGTPRQRIVDLDPAAVHALGLDESLGLWPVRVTPVDSATGLPDTAAR
jgi:hypothetical protein